MNAGANVALGDVLWFLHADCQPHPDSIRAIRQALEDRAIVGGGFEYNLDHHGLFFRLTEVTSNLKNRLLKLLYGDMGIFVRRDIFRRMGGYRDIPLMEDMDFCKRLKRFGKIVILPQRIETSARRWVEEGIIAYLLRTQLLKIGWALGVAPDNLARWYQFKRGRF
jgi:glycosyltransferase involved in cell wall biosynthesis